MPGPVCKDSMGRCEPPSMLYDTIRNPNAPYISTAKVIGVSSTDSMESTQQRLNREVQERFRLTGLRLPHESFVAVAQVGKFLFLAIMLPPYLCLYGIPRWMLFTIMPLCFEFSKSLMMRMGRFVQECSKRIIDLMKGLLDQTLGEALRTVHKFSQNVWQRVVSRSRQFFHLVTEQWGHVKTWTQSLQHSCVDAVHQMLATVKQWLERGQQWVQRQSKNLAEGVTKRIAQAVQQIKTIVSDPFIHAVLSPLEQLKKMLKTTRRRIDEFASSVRRHAQKYLEAFTRPLQQIQTWFGEQVKELGHILAQQPLVVWAKEKMETYRSAIRNTWRKVTNPISEAIERVNVKIEKFTSKCRHAVEQVVQQISTSIAQIPMWVWEWLPPQFKRQWFRSGSHARKLKGRLRHFKKVFTARSREIAEELNERILKPLYRRWKWLKNLRQEVKVWIRKQLIALPHHIINGLIWLGFFIEKVIKRLLLGLRRLWAWVMLFWRLGMQLVHELAEEIASWVRFG